MPEIARRLAHYWRQLLGTRERRSHFDWSLPYNITPFVRNAAGRDVRASERRTNVAWDPLSLVSTSINHRRNV